MKFEWEPENSVGIKAFDQQHRRFFKLVGEMNELAGSTDISRESLLAKIEEFSDYSLYHLEEEEWYFEKYGYDEAALHIAAHDVYRDKVKEFKQKVEGQTAGEEIGAIARDFAEFSIRWLTGHIMGIDKKYESFFREKGLE